MAIDSVYIDNYKSIRESGFISIKALNVLIGPNGVGKSNFISFFKLLNSISQKRLPSFIAENGYADRMLHFGRKKSKYLSGGIVFRSSTGDINNRYDFVLKPDPLNGFYFEKEAGGFNDNVYGSNVYGTGSPKWSYMLLDSQGERNSGLRDHTATRFEYLREYFDQLKVFHFHDTSDNAPLRQPAKLRDNVLLREDGSNLAAFLYLIQEQHPSNFKLIEYAVRSVAPFFERFELRPDKLNPELIFLTWQAKESDEYFDAGSLSDGTLRFIAQATLLLQPDPPKTIIIDEPELGLHPYAIHKLAALMKAASAKAQIILSTQSVNLLDQFEADDVIVVERKDNQSTFKRLNSEELSNWVGEYSLGEMWGKNVIGGTP
ncbi:MAG: ABC transport protein, ATP-binding subunit [uncultured Cytophagales bacterium]|uniref:ABC transport protein, ATP-binding subunit n=1 Tax=uncultured Cytophagales bacterium TaxID=158755 RepID=A0A6J4HQ86_9SPHI|nr:MAG: ABC transport protein, ATP-binding subunit [uncultured Cytophagales bacterium]